MPVITARVSRNIGAVHADGAVLSTRRLPVAGKIRPGIKVLTKAAAANPALAKCYADGLAAGASFDEISVALGKVPKAPSWPLTPKNVGYFSVRQGDFATPGAAAEIMARYGEVRTGDTEPRLYAFPIIFPSDALDLVFREQFEAWKATELLRWSEPDPDAGTLQCMKRADTAPTPGAGRRWGGRPTAVDRACNPNDCDLFAKGECKHVATLHFWIPGVKGAGVISMTFTSLYASMGIAETLEMVRAGLGRISGLHNGEPIFWLSKGHEKVRRMNWETGKPETSQQWIIRLEASGLDMMAVLGGPAPTATLPAPAPVPALAAPVHDPEPAPAAPAVDPAQAEGRKYLGALFSTLGWDRQTQQEWLDINFPDRGRMPDVKTLAAMAAKLEPLLSVTRPAIDVPVETPEDPAGQIHDQAPPVGTDEVPF